MLGPEVAYIDFRESTFRPESAEKFVEHAAEVDTRFRAAIGTSNGIIKPWSWLIVDTPSGVANYLSEYLNLATSSFQFNLLFLIDASSEFLDEELRALSLPEELVKHHNRVKFILLTDHKGVMWAAGTAVPSGVVFWEKDVEGSQSIELIADVLREQVVFSEVFENLKQSGASTWALGTRQIWMGKLSGELTQDAFVEVGRDVLGSGQLSHREFKEWIRPPHLIGKASVPEVIISDGGLDVMFKELKTSIDSFRAATGDTTRKRLLDRVANFPKRQQDTFKKIENTHGQLDERTRTLITSIDPSNGFDREELLQLRFDGINLRVVHQQDEGSQNLLNGFLQSILVQTRLAIEEGHSLEQIQHSLEITTIDVEPRGNVVVEDEMVSALDYSKELLSNASSINQKPPLGVIARLGRKIASLLKSNVFRYVSLFLYLWTISAAVYEILSEPDSTTYGYIPWPSAIRQIFHLTAFFLSLLFTGLIITLGVCLYLADEKIRHWGNNHQANLLQKSSDEVKDLLVSIATNDWACHDIRSEVYGQLLALEDVFNNVAFEIESGFVEPFRDIDPEELDIDLPNPQVREDLNARAQGRAFKYLVNIKEILRLDLADMIDESLELTYALRTSAGLVSVPVKVQQKLHNSIGKYVRDGKHFGLLFEHLSSSSNAKAQRRELAQKIWEEPGLIDESLQTVVLMPSPAEMVTFVGQNHLGLLASDQDESIEIRFLPACANSRLGVVSNKLGYSPHVMTTDSLSAAGIIRVTPLKTNIVHLAVAMRDED